MARQRRERGRLSLGRFLMLVVSCVVFFAFFSRMLINKAMFQPPPPTYGPDDGFQFLELESGIRLAYYASLDEPGAWTLLYFHGNAEDLGQALPLLANYGLQGYNVVAFDYRGYGLSEGRPTERTVLADAERAYQHVVDELGVEPRRLAVLGRSLGSGPAVELASRHEVGALILESPFLSIYELALPLKWWPGDKFANKRKIEKVTCPTLIVHGELDRVIPIEHGKELARRLGEEQVTTLWIPQAGHNDLLARAGPEYWKTLRNFLDEAGEGP